MKDVEVDIFNHDSMDNDEQLRIKDKQLSSDQIKVAQLLPDKPK